MARASSPLRYQSESDDGEVMIEGVSEPDARSPHDHEARRVHGRQLAQIGAAEVLQRQSQVARLTWKNFDSSGRIDRALPDQCHGAGGVAVEERERLDDDRNGSV